MTVPTNQIIYNYVCLRDTLDESLRDILVKLFLFQINVQPFLTCSVKKSRFWELDNVKNAEVFKILFAESVQH